MFSFPFPLSKGLQEDLMTRCMAAQTEYLFQNLEFSLSETWPVLLCFLSPFPFPRVCRKIWWLVAWARRPSISSTTQNLVLARRDLSCLIMFSFPFPLSKGLQEDLMTRCMGAQAKYLFQNLEFRLSETWPVLLGFLSPFPFPRVCRKIWWRVAWARRPSISSRT